MKQLGSLCLFAFLFHLSTEAQKFTTTNAQKLIMTNEDSLNSGTNTQKTVISGYGSAFYQRNFNQQQSTATLERAVLFVGHQFSQKISFFSELEIENAKVEGGVSNNAEISMEQAFLKFNLNELIPAKLPSTSKLKPFLKLCDGMLNILFFGIATSSN